MCSLLPYGTGICHNAIYNTDTLHTDSHTELDKVLHRQMFALQCYTLSDWLHVSYFVLYSLTLSRKSCWMGSVTVAAFCAATALRPMLRRPCCNTCRPTIPTRLTTCNNICNTTLVLLICDWFFHKHAAQVLGMVGWGGGGLSCKIWLVPHANKMAVN